RDMAGSEDAAWHATVAEAARTVSCNLMSVDGTLYRRCGTPLLTLQVHKGSYLQVNLADSADFPESATTTCFGLSEVEALTRFSAGIAPRRNPVLPPYRVEMADETVSDTRTGFAAGAARWMQRELRHFAVGMFPAAAVQGLRIL